MKTARPTPADLTRLDAIVRNLHVGKKWHGPEMSADVVAACLDQAGPALTTAPHNGEKIAICLANHYSVKFETVRQLGDIIQLEDRYLKGEGETGFALLRDEFSTPDVDAVLLMRTKVSASAKDRWIAVLNLQWTAIREYWDRFHELAHRIAEPPQKLFLFRQKDTLVNPVEALMDAIAGELAFYPPIFRPLTKSVAAVTPEITFELVETIRNTYSPTASLLSVLNAVVKNWPTPAMAFTAQLRSKKGSSEGTALRISPQARNQPAHTSGLFFIPNMRVPQTSPAFSAISGQGHTEGYERLGTWSTSDGKSLKDIRVFTSAKSLKGMVYGVISAA